MVEFGAARPKEISQLVELLGFLFEQEAEFTADAGKQEAALKLIFADAKVGRVFVARDGAKVVAMASLLYTVSTAEGGRAALFEDLVVRPDYRKQGIGAKLLEHVIEQARAQGLLRLTLLTDMQNERSEERRVGKAWRSRRQLRAE